MGFVVDTSVWVDVERGVLTPAQVVEVTGEEPVYLTPTIFAELWYGVHRARTESQRTKRLAAMTRLRRKPCLSLDAATGEIVGRLASELDRIGRPSKHRLHDLWIAAAAIQYSFGLLTRNPRDFRDIPGLDVAVI